MWWDIIERNRVTGIFTSPTAIRLLAKYGAELARKHDLSSVERGFCAGEVLNPSAWRWLQEEVFEGEVPVIDHMWQTETGGPIIGNPNGIAPCPIKPGSSGVPAPGIDAEGARGVVGGRPKPVQPVVIQQRADVPRPGQEQHVRVALAVAHAVEVGLYLPAEHGLLGDVEEQDV